MRLQPRVSRALRSLWRAVRGSADDTSTPLLEDVDPHRTPVHGLDVTLRVEDSALLVHSPSVTCALLTDALCGQLRTERDSTSRIDLTSDSVAALALDANDVEEIASWQNVALAIRYDEHAPPSVTALWKAANEA